MSIPPALQTRIDGFQASDFENTFPQFEISNGAAQWRSSAGSADVTVSASGPPRINEKVWAAFACENIAVRCFFDAEHRLASDPTQQHSLGVLATGFGIVYFTERYTAVLLHAVRLFGELPTMNDTRWSLTSIENSSVASLTLSAKRGRPTGDFTLTANKKGLRCAVSGSFDHRYNAAANKRERLKAKNLQDELAPAIAGLWAQANSQAPAWAAEGDDLVQLLPASDD